MAGVYIKGMQMPMFEHQSLDIRHGTDGKWYAIDTNAETSDGEWHEIIPVPDHGRLGDLDELAQSMRNRKNYIGRLSDPDCLVTDAPTVIPADKKGEA